MASAQQDRFVIFKGDDTGGSFGRRLAFVIEADEGADLTGCRAEWIFDGIVKEFAAPLVAGETREVFYSHNETAQMRLGVHYGSFRIIDAAGKVRTFTNTKAVEVTNDVARCYSGASSATIHIGSDFGDMKHSEFADLEQKEGMTLKEVGAMVNRIVGKLKGGAAAVAFALIIGAAATTANAELTPQTEFGDVPPSATIGEVVTAGGGGGGGGVDTNAVKDIVRPIVGAAATAATNYTDAAIAAIPPVELPANALVWTNTAVKTKAGFGPIDGSKIKMGGSDGTSVFSSETIANNLLFVDSAALDAYTKAEEVETWASENLAYKDEVVANDGGSADNLTVTDLTVDGITFTDTVYFDNSNVGVHFHKGRTYLGTTTSLGLLESVEQFDTRKRDVDNVRFGNGLYAGSYGGTQLWVKVENFNTPSLQVKDNNTIVSTVKVPSKSGVIALTDDIPDAYTKTESDEKYVANDDTYANVKTRALNSAQYHEYGYPFLGRQDLMVKDAMVVGTTNYAQRAQHTEYCDGSIQNEAMDCYLYLPYGRSGNIAVEDPFEVSRLLAMAETNETAKADICEKLCDIGVNDIKDETSNVVYRLEADGTRFYFRPIRPINMED